MRKREKVSELHSGVVYSKAGKGMGMKPGTRNATTKILIQMRHSAAIVDSRCDRLTVLTARRRKARKTPIHEAGSCDSGTGRAAADSSLGPIAVLPKGAPEGGYLDCTRVQGGSIHEFQVWGIDRRNGIFNWK